MLNSNFIGTIIPIILLVGAGFLARKLKILRAGDERVFSAFVYYFALPALFLVNLAETNFNFEIIKFVLSGILPLLVVIIVFFSLQFMLKFSEKTLYLLILSTIFGSLAFFGIPFLTFAFPGNNQVEQLTTLAAGTIGIVGVILSIITLESYRLGKNNLVKGIPQVLKRLIKNPLVISIIAGIFISFIKINIPIQISQSLHMLGGTSSTVAIFMLGVFLYGRKYNNLFKAFKLSLLRMIFLPIIAFIIASFLEVTNLEKLISVLMHGTPLAVSMLILSERYDFEIETFASLILISTIEASIYMNIWLLLLSNL